MNTNNLIPWKTSLYCFDSLAPLFRCRLCRRVMLPAYAIGLKRRAMIGLKCNVCFICSLDCNMSRLLSETCIMNQLGFSASSSFYHKDGLFTDDIKYSRFENLMPMPVEPEHPDYISLINAVGPCKSCYVTKSGSHIDKFIHEDKFICQPYVGADTERKVKFCKEYQRHLTFSVLPKMNRIVRIKYGIIIMIMFYKRQRTFPIEICRHIIKFL